jgi:hypothetical protein
LNLSQQLISAGRKEYLYERGLIYLARRFIGHARSDIREGFLFTAARRAATSKMIPERPSYPPNEHDLGKIARSARKTETRSGDSIKRFDIRVCA